MDTTTVHVADSQAEADIIAGLLREEGLEVITETHASYAEAPTSGGEGTVDITVPTAQADRARLLLADRRG